MMPYPPDAADIPTLTERADGPAVSHPSVPADHDHYPVLKEIVSQPPAYARTAAPSETFPPPASTPGTSGTPPDALILSIRLQTELEPLLQAVLAQAIVDLQTRLDNELPALVDRLLKEIKQG